MGYMATLNASLTSTNTSGSHCAKSSCQRADSHEAGTPHQSTGDVGKFNHPASTTRFCQSRTSGLGPKRRTSATAGKNVKIRLATGTEIEVKRKMSECTDLKLAAPGLE